MTDPHRSSTLSLRHAPGAAPTGSRPAAPRESGAPVAAPPATDAARTLRSETLLQGHSYVSILHNGETYQLRATRLGKLILTK
ncbi:hemin uptake protein HemP [Burkholderia sp. WAC0059]|uniref:hemin uptake protein HemP n=1 Tax=Burkholderia sp. WAC0059 TaxID=2066022 RepID=UPI000C7EBFC0|nr:hemin uptake protein HemP [Burkholderia sp. WAC0059]PLZ03015.1 hemin uptake protein HemP [Burkholderia sp. WAC0059]